MTRHQVLRTLDCGWFTAGFISLFNYLFFVPKGRISFMNMTIDYDPSEPYDEKEHYRITPRNDLV